MILQPKDTIIKPQYAPIWKAQPGMQTKVLSVYADEVLLGGARGGGKTDAAFLGCWPLHVQQCMDYGIVANGVVLRKLRVGLEDTIHRLEQFYPKIGGKYNETKHLYRFPGGHRLSFSYIEHEKDVELYKGRNINFLIFEELTQIVSEDFYVQLLAIVRGRGPKRVISTTNPDGPGSPWVYRRFIKPAPMGNCMMIRDDENPVTGVKTRATRVFYPARVDDNAELLKDDPGYPMRLRALCWGNEARYKAWIEGIWGAAEGQFFDGWEKFTKSGILYPFVIPESWPKFVAVDWGSSTPFSVLWLAVVPRGDAMLKGRHQGQILPHGSLVVFKEWYGAKRDMRGQVIGNKGVGLNSSEFGSGLVQHRMKCDTPGLNYGVADPDMFRRKDGAALMDRIWQAEKEAIVRMNLDISAIRWIPADNTRAGRDIGYAGGWDEVRRRLAGQMTTGRPLLYIFASCPDLIRIMPDMLHDPSKPEDMLKQGMEDHAADALRYACMSRPLQPGMVAPVPLLDQNSNRMTSAEVIAKREATTRWAVIDESARTH